MVRISWTAGQQNVADEVSATPILQIRPKIHRYNIQVIITDLGLRPISKQTNRLTHLTNLLP